MIVPETRQLVWLTVRYVGRPLLFLLVYDVAVVLAYKAGYLHWAPFQQIPLSLFGSAIGVILAFRNTTSYSRWWEARTLWGAIVNNSRSWGRQVTTVMRPIGEGDAAELRRMQQQMVYLQIAWVNALRQHLRRLEPWEEIARVLSPEEIAELRCEKNVPVAILQRESVLLRDALDHGWVDMAQWRAMDESLNDLIDAQGGSEKIKNTPMPRQYDYLPQIFVHMYCILLPLALVSSLGWLTPLGSTLVGFIFLALDKSGRDVEDPFDNRVHDIPLTAMCRTIEINLRQILGETEIPPDAKPVDGVLW
jgi:putative membrane protein